MNLITLPRIGTWDEFANRRRYPSTKFLSHIPCTNLLPLDLVTFAFVTCTIGHPVSNSLYLSSAVFRIPVWTVPANMVWTSKPEKNTGPVYKHGMKSCTRWKAVCLCKCKWPPSSTKCLFKAMSQYIKHCVWLCLPYNMLSKYSTYMLPFPFHFHVIKFKWLELNPKL